MRSRSALSLFSASLMMASGLLMACGNGDDNTSPVPPVPDASVSGGDGGHGADAGDAGAKTAADGGGSDGSAATASLKHVYVIMMENHAYAQILGDGGAAAAPNLNMLAQAYGTATQYYGVTHPSLPNYLAAISGDFQGIWDDCNAGAGITCAPEEFVANSGDGTENDLMSPAQFANASTIPHWFSGQTIVDQLEANNLTWTAYMGALPAEGDVSAANPANILDFASDGGSGFVEQFALVDTSDDAGNDAGFLPLGAPLTTAGNLYAQKHNPFEYFSNIRGNTRRMQKIVPFSNFAADITGTEMPNYVWISPDQCQDIHSVNTSTGAWLDGGTEAGAALGPVCSSGPASGDMSADLISYGDAFVGDTVGKIMASPTWSEGSAIVIIFDEDDYKQTQGCCNSPTSDDGGVLGGAQVPAIVVSSLVSGPVTSADPYNHYSMLATLQHIWGLGCLANTCGMSGDQLMTSLFLPSATAAVSDAGSPSDGAATGDN
jgi:hypothetical protein